MEQGATYLPGCSLKYDSFIPCMWQAVQTGHVTHADALACGEGLRYGFTCGVDITKLQGYLTFENYQSAIGAGEAVVKGINKRIEAGKTVVLGAWGDALDATLRETYSAYRVGPMGAVEKSEFEPNEKRMTNDHTRTGLNDATTLDSTLSFSLDAYDEIAYFFQTGKFMRVSDVEAAFLLIPLHPDLWPFFMHKFKAIAGDAAERLCMNVFGDFGARGMPGTFHLLFTRVICGMARSQKVLTMPMITYVDDCSLIGDDRALVDAEMEAFHRFCATVCDVGRMGRCVATFRAATRTTRRRSRTTRSPRARTTSGRWLSITFFGNRPFIDTTQRGAHATLNFPQARSCGSSS